MTIVEWCGCICWRKQMKCLTSSELGKHIKIQIDRKIKRLRTDNGFEFYNKKFGDFCVTHGIIRHKTIRHMPQ